MKKALSLALIAAMAGGSAAVQAYEAGDIIVRVGATTVAPNDDSETVPGLGVKVEVDNDTQLGLIGTYMISEKFGVELLAATPFSHDISVDGAPLEAGETKHLPPTLSAQWYPRGGQDGWQPYVGIGVNYTIFFSEDTHGDLEGIVGKADLELEDSFGLAAQVGVDIPLGENWGLNAGVWYIDIDTEAEVSFTGGKAKFDVDIDPWVYNVGLFYKF
jgi:outer membrane protein